MWHRASWSPFRCKGRGALTVLFRILEPIESNVRKKKYNFLFALDGEGENNCDKTVYISKFFVNLPCKFLTRSVPL